MRNFLGCFGSIAALVTAAPAFAEDAPAAPPPAITINGTATVTTDYRFRGISQTDKNFAVQGSLTVTHESGLYVSVWGSSVDSYVTAAGDFYRPVAQRTSCCTARAELDLIAGFKKTVGNATIDVGVLYYYYPKSKAPGDRTSSDFVEPYLSVSGTAGPLTAKATVNWAPKQKALALDQLSPSRSNVYLAGDFSAALPNTPFGLTAHIGHSIGPSWLATTGRGNNYVDWGLGVTATFKALTLSVNYIDTNTTYFTPSGKDAAKGGIVAALGVSF